MTDAPNPVFLGPIVASGESTSSRLFLADYYADTLTDNDFATFGVEVPATMARAVPKRKAEYLAGRLLAKHGLAALGFSALPIGRDRFGAPVWQMGVQGSISHSKGCAGVWLTTENWHPGLDIEYLVTARAAQAVRQIVLTKPEYSMMLGPDALTAVFSAKEALYKSLYPKVRRRFGFHAAELVRPPQSDALHLRLTQDLAPSLRSGAQFKVDVDWQKDRVICRCRSPF